MIDIAGWKFSEEDVALAAQIARDYSKHPYEHPYGLCWVMLYENHFEGTDMIYAVRQHWAGGARGAREYVTSYVTREHGPVPARILFARQLADYLDGRLAFLKVAA